MNVPRMRTAQKASDELKRLDPETALSAKSIINLMDNGKLGYTSIGRKRLINFDDLLRLLSSHEDEGGDLDVGYDEFLSMISVRILCLSRS